MGCEGVEPRGRHLGRCRKRRMIRIQERGHEVVRGSYTERTPSCNPNWQPSVESAGCDIQVSVHTFMRDLDSD